MNKQRAPPVVNAPDPPPAAAAAASAGPDLSDESADSARESKSKSHSHASSSSLPLAVQSASTSSHPSQRKHLSGDSMSTDSPTPQKWFDQANKHPESRFQHAHLDHEPPFFLPGSEESDTSMADAASDHHLLPVPLRAGQPRPPTTVLATNDSSIDDYRSVIDDLTVENQKLKQRLRRYQSHYGPQMDKDKLFEVRVHGLPNRKKRELEDLLRRFVATLDHASTDSPANPSKLSRNFHTSTSNTSGQPSTSSGSHSRPIDSAYASISTTGKPGQPPTSGAATAAAAAAAAATAAAAGHPNPTLNLDPHHMSSRAKNQKVQSFLRDIPQGLLPKQFPVMSDKAKKKLVVRRLEQLFTGKQDTSALGNNQPKQQQEISNQAASADLLSTHHGGELPLPEGTREAHILPVLLERDRRAHHQHHQHQHQHQHQQPPPPRPNQNIVAAAAAAAKDDDDDLDPWTSAEQRPTRPLDLDPDRAQNPDDNIEYIRHLGLSLAHPAQALATDAASDHDGWIYLNLLINMAQLHIINVTPDFVRSALAEVSEKFQLSRDGRKVRWKGGVEGTRFSSDSGSSAKHGSPSDSDHADSGGKKRRKLESQSSNEHEHSTASSKMMSGPQQISHASGSHSANNFHYKPLFRHAPLSKGDFAVGESDSQTSQSPEYDSVTGLPLPRKQNSRASSSTKPQDDRPIVFYSGAPFYTDLSADKSALAEPMTGPQHHPSASRAAWSTAAAPGVVPRTPSGSTLPFRPLRDYAQRDVPRAQTPEPTISADGDGDLAAAVAAADDDDHISFSPQWTSQDASQPQELLELEVSGLGGTRPADHFTIMVETERTILNHKSRTRLSKYSAPGRRPRRVVHRIDPTSLASFADDDATDLVEHATARLDAHGRHQPAGGASASRLELPVKTVLLSARLRTLSPSELPPPGTLFGVLSSSSSEYNSSDESVEFTRRRSGTPSLPMLDLPANEDSSEKESGHVDDENHISDDSIDMLGRPIPKSPTAARRTPPLDAAAAHQRFSREIPAGSSAATNGGGSGYSSQHTSDSS